MQTYCKIEMQPKPLQLGLLTFQRPNALVTLPNSSTINNDGRLRSTGKPGPQRKNTRCANTCKRPFLGSLHNAFSKASLSPCCLSNNVTNDGTQLLLNTVVAGFRTRMHHSLQPKMMTNCSSPTNYQFRSLSYHSYHFIFSLVWHPCYYCLHGIWQPSTCCFLICLLCVVIVDVCLASACLPYADLFAARWDCRRPFVSFARYVGHL